MHLRHRLLLGRPATIIPLETTTPAGYMQMTAEQTESWTQSANAYVADEEESLFSVRTSGELLLAELLQQFDDKAGAALLEAIRQRLQEADAAKAGSQDTEDAEAWPSQHNKKKLLTHLLPGLLVIAAAVDQPSGQGSHIGVHHLVTALAHLGSLLAQLAQHLLQARWAGFHFRPSCQCTCVWKG